jgi:hypothetical protein
MTTPLIESVFTKVQSLLIYINGDNVAVSVSLRNRKPYSSKSQRRKMGEVSIGRETLFALCEDGTVWALKEGTWRKSPDIKLEKGSK